MNLLEEIYLKRDIQREKFLSIIEIIDMIEGVESVDYDNVLDILEHFNVFALPTYILSNDDKNPLYKESQNQYFELNFLLSQVNPDELTPKDAHDLLYQLKQLVSNSAHL